MYFIEDILIEIFSYLDNNQKLTLFDALGHSAQCGSKKLYEIQPIIDTIMFDYFPTINIGDYYAGLKRYKPMTNIKRIIIRSDQIDKLKIYPAILDKIIVKENERKKNEIKSINAKKIILLNHWCTYELSPVNEIIKGDRIDLKIKKNITYSLKKLYVYNLDLNEQLTTVEHLDFKYGMMFEETLKYFPSLKSLKIQVPYANIKTIYDFPTLEILDISDFDLINHIDAENLTTLVIRYLDTGDVLDPIKKKYPKIKKIMINRVNKKIKPSDIKLEKLQLYILKHTYKADDFPNVKELSINDTQY